ncbi:MotA/TolQ/ExbB proton channel family protein [Sneathiella aquimaris]|uniref:MotA/TolQ/ExbB proton channel family protein n=1 Tax=Sneathiella aquimaris TaxID=2599305 RepID=UPI00146A9534|nr:MotA/TolQ/ExbB proton channel family protein [Sneathiella aquimaris]
MPLDGFEKLGPMGIPLVLCSVLAAMVVLERLVYSLKFGRQKKKVLSRLNKLLSDHADCSKPLRDEIVSDALEKLRVQSQSGIRFLRIIATLSPLIGLLGTILGIVTAFKVIASQTGPVSPNLIADGLWEAMLTTGFGLFIALPSIFLAYLFQYFSEQRLAALASALNAASLEQEVMKERAAMSAGSGVPTPRDQAA